MEEHENTNPSALIKPTNATASCVNLRVNAIPPIMNIWSASATHQKWHINVHCGKKGFCVPQHKAQSMEEMPGDMPVHQGTWRRPYNGLQEGGSPSPSLCLVAQEEHCQSPATLAFQATGVYVSAQMFRNNNHFLLYNAYHKTQGCLTWPL